MKRKLFLLLCALLTMIGVQAADLPASGSGEYFIKNVETGTFLKGDMYWGTKACVWDDPYLLTLTYVSEGVYTIKSQQNNGGQNQYITAGDDPYVDGALANMTFTEVDGENHYFTINNGTGNLTAVSQTEDGVQLYKVMATTETSTLAQWEVISKNELIAALDVASASNPVVATFFMKDPGFDVKSVNAGSWTTSNVDLGGGGNAGHSAESWNKANFNIYQTVTGLPNGKYRVECYGYYRWNNGTDNDNKAAVAGHTSGDEVLNAKLYAGTKEVALMSVAGDAEAMAFCQTMGWADNTPNSQWQAAACFAKGYYKNTLEDVVVTDGTLTIGVKKDTQAGTDWAVFDEFKLFYMGEDLSIYVQAYHDARDAANAVDQSAPMLGTALTALQTAISTYGSGVDEESKDALLTATSALNSATTNANTSIAAYAGVSAAVSAANAIKTNHNFASTEAIATFTSAISHISDNYDARTLANEEASNAAVTLGTAISGWHGNANGAASKYLNNGFGLNDFDAALYVNTWSIEGETDGSNFKVPFYEYWTGDANSLPEKTWEGEVTVPTGQYQISALVRVRAKNGVAPAEAKGISMQVTDGDVVDVTEGTQVGSSQFQLKEYEAIGLVKDGKLKFNMIIAADNNISWLSFKNVKYTKLRDLTPEEAAIAPEDLSLEATKTVFRAKPVTLTPTSSTEGASIAGYTTWESDNTDVATVDANGVVTGVGYGTANITVTSTLNASATATCAVTVDAPAVAELENIDFTDGPVVAAHIRTYAKDKKGTDVAQMQPVSGWAMAVANGDAKAAGVMAYGSSYGMGSDDASFYAPATNPQGEASGDALGMVGVWTGSVQYVQYVKLAPGAYTVTVPVYRNGGESALTKNLIGVILDDNTEYLAKTTVYAANQWTTEVIKFNLASETYAKLSAGLNAPNTGSANSQRLWIDGFTIVCEPLADADDYADLNTAIETAEGYTLGFEDGEYAPYNNIDAQMALVNAKAVDQSAPNAKIDIETITNDVLTSWTANSGDVEAVYNGNFAEGQGSPAAEIQQYGWTRTNGWGQFINDVYGSTTGYYNQPGSLQYGNAGYYTMPLKANTVYRLQFQYGAWDGAPQPTVSVLNEEKGMAAQIFDATSVSYKEGLTSVDMLFVTADAGNYILTLANNGNIVFTGASITKAASQTLTITDGEELPKFAPGTYPSATYSRSLTPGNKWGTICVPFNLKSDENIQFYNVSSIGYGVLNVETVTEVAAGVPAIFKKLAPEATISVTTNEATVVSAPAEAEDGENAKLVGTFTGTTIEGVSAGNYFYVMTDQFWRGNEKFTIPAYRAYVEDLTATNPGARLVICVDGEDPTAINAIEAAEAEEGALKDGKYLINNKVVLVKNGVKYGANGQKLN